MDFLSHGLWGALSVYPKYKKEPKKILAALGVGMLPDVISFLPAQAYFVFTGFRFSPDLFFPVPQHWVFEWAIQSYNFTHSLIVWSLVALATFVWIRLDSRLPPSLKLWRTSRGNDRNGGGDNKEKTENEIVLNRKGKARWLWLLLPWLLHVLMDIPTHPDFFQTPFLFPISNWKFFGGISWANPYVFFTNWALLIIFIISIYFSRKKALKN